MIFFLLLFYLTPPPCIFNFQLQSHLGCVYWSGLSGGEFLPGQSRTHPHYYKFSLKRSKMPRAQFQKAVWPKQLPFSKLYCLANFCRGPTRPNALRVIFWLVACICYITLFYAKKSCMLNSFMNLAPAPGAPIHLFAPPPPPGHPTSDMGCYL